VGHWISILHASPHLDGQWDVEDATHGPHNVPHLVLALHEGATGALLVDEVDRAARLMQLCMDAHTHARARDKTIRNKSADVHKQQKTHTHSTATRIRHTQINRRNVFARDEGRTHEIEVMVSKMTMITGNWQLSGNGRANAARQSSR